MIYFDGDFAPELLKLIQSATKKIDVCMYVWRWYNNKPAYITQQIYTELLRAKARGVAVRVLTDFAGVAERMKSDGFDVIAVPASKTLHAKMFIIDETAVSCGSHNMTNRANTSSYEATIIDYDFEVIQQAERYFGIVWAHYAGS